MATEPRNALKIDPELASALPPLSGDEYDRLKSDIAARGILCEVIADADGVVVDGHHRLLAAQQLGISEIPQRLLSFSSAAARVATAISLNEARRQLSPEQQRELDKRKLATAKELAAQGWTEARIGKLLGAAQQTVSLWLAPNMQNTGIGNLHTCRKTKITADGQEEVYRRIQNGQTQEQIAGDFKVDQTTISRIAAKIGRRHERLERAQKNAASFNNSDAMQLRCCSMQELLATQRGLDAIITDPPYPAEFLPLFGELAKFAKDALKPNGTLAVMCGQSYLPQILRDMCKHMPYRWTMAYLTPGGDTKLWQRKINCAWKPILLFGGDHDLYDVVQSPTAEHKAGSRDHHHWGQTVGGLRKLVSMLTEAADLVCDPFLGGGSTALACWLEKRRFIGCDIDEKALAQSKGRIAEAISA